MRTKRPVGERRERLTFAGVNAFSGVFAVRGRDFLGLRVLGPAAAERPCEVFSVVAAAFSSGGHRHRLGHVPVFTLTATPHTDTTVN